MKGQEKVTFSVLFLWLFSHFRRFGGCVGCACAAAPPAAHRHPTVYSSDNLNRNCSLVVVKGLLGSHSSPSNSLPSTTLFSANAYVLFHGNLAAKGSTLQNRPMRVSCMRYSKACKAPSPNTSLSASCPLKKYR